MKGKGDGPDRFWSTVEPYFADITESDINTLQETIDGVSVGGAGWDHGGCGLGWAGMGLWREGTTFHSRWSFDWFIMSGVRPTP